MRDKHFGFYSTRGAAILPLDLLLDSLTVFSLMFHGNAELFGIDTEEDL